MPRRRSSRRAACILTAVHGMALLSFDHSAIAGEVCPGSLVIRNGKVCDRSASLTGSSVVIRNGEVVAPVVIEVPQRGCGASADWNETAVAAAKLHGVPSDLFLALIERESCWNPKAISPKGAVGLAQIMPDTAAELGVDPLIPEQNLEGGARYLKRQFLTFGSWELALAAYNAGPGAVETYRGVPPFAETVAYVDALSPFASRDPQDRPNGD